MRKKIVGLGANTVDPMQALLAALSDDLALPLLQIKSTLESLNQQSFNKKTSLMSNEQIGLSAENGLHLIEAYKLTLRVNRTLDEMAFETVSIGAVLQDVAHELTPYAKKYATDLQVDVSGKLTPVLTHQPSLQSAIQVLSASLIRAQSSQSQQKRYRIVLGARRTPDSAISTGVYSNINGLSDKALRDARYLVGRARQPVQALPNGSASGVLIADMLCSSLWQPLRSAAHSGMHGLATAIPISKQLQFV